MRGERIFGLPQDRGVSNVTDRLEDRRATARTEAEAILARAAEQSRDLTSDELAEHGHRVAEEREAADEITRHLGEQISDLRASVANRTGAPVLSRTRTPTSSSAR